MGTLTSGSGTRSTKTVKSSNYKITYSDFYESYICIYMDPETNKWTIKKCESPKEAKIFVESLIPKQVFWYDKD